MNLPVGGDLSKPQVKIKFRLAQDPRQIRLARTLAHPVAILF